MPVDTGWPILQTSLSAESIRLAGDTGMPPSLITMAVGKYWQAYLSVATGWPILQTGLAADLIRLAGYSGKPLSLITPGQSNPAIWQTKEIREKSSGGASRWRVCYQRGLPRLVSSNVELFLDFFFLLSSWIFCCVLSDCQVLS